MIKINVIVSSHTYRYFTIIVVIDSDTSMNITIETSIGPYNKMAADQASRNSQPYAYIAGIVRTSDIDSYPHSYTLGDGNESRNGDTNYNDVPLQADTQYTVVVRAHTVDDLVVNCVLCCCVTF